jgi:hypothetical protein
MLRHLLDLLDRKASLRQKQPPRARLTIELLEDRLVPALPYNIQGPSGTFTLSNTGQLTVLTAAGTTTLETICSSFNVDQAGNLFELNSKGMLWELPSGANHKVVGPGGWRFLDRNIGSFSMSTSTIISPPGGVHFFDNNMDSVIVSSNGTLEEVKLNGTLWRFANGVFDARPLASGVTRADVDAAGNVYALQNGNLLKWAPGQSTATLLNNGSTAAGNSPGDVVSFQMGNNTVAWQLGLQDTHKGAVEVSFQNGQSPVVLSDNNNATAVIKQYGVDAAGFLFVVDSGAATNKGVTILQSGGGATNMVTNVDNGTDIAVNGNAHAATSFALSSDGTLIGVLDTTNGNLSGWRTMSLDAAANAAAVSAAEGKSSTSSTAAIKNAAIGAANDDGAIFLYTNATAGSGGTLQEYFLETGGIILGTRPLPFVPLDAPAQTFVQPVTLGPPAGSDVIVFPPGPSFFLSGPFTVSANVAQWQLGPNGDLAYLTTDGSLNVASLPTATGVAQFGFAPNGQLYYLSTAGTLFQGTGSFATSGGYNFSQIDTGVAAFVVNSDSALLDIESNGDVWRLTGSPGNVLGGISPASTSYNGWVQLDSGANVGALPGAKQAVGVGGTPLFALPNGNFYLLVGGAFTELSANRSTVYAIGQGTITLEGDDTRVAGITANVPALDALLAAGSSFSTLSTSGLNAIAQTLF